ncbi:hypothetical protein GQE99_20500 [Maritimibacter sp. DP07]|uniref:CDP-Glycerol:Poly(Glycerophosphate) glycerophosphotransferase n=1 Tax=Maritimibacter harenae TaxID=2606218 RepID=A0A845M4Y0_9RHOB|nr:hypothetical protein [Maritimibacter harenae]MZR15400.1 hypothetical protein [Maritimibacter harenae]
MRFISGALERLRSAIPDLSRPKRIEEALDQLHQRNEALENKIDALLRNGTATLGAASLGAKYAKNVVNNEGRIRVAFLIHNFEAWWSLRSVYFRMLTDDSFDPIVFSLPRKFPGSVDFIDEDKVHERLAAEGVHSIRLNDSDPFRDLDRLRSFEFDAIFRQSQWAPDIPPAFDSLNLSFAHQYYVPYEVTTISDHGLDFVSTYHHQLCARVFVASELSKSIAESKDIYRGARMTVSGHPKVPEIIRASPSWPIDTGNATRVIWSAHHAIDTGWNNYGVFPLVFEELLKLATRRTDIDVLFSPHPALLTRIQEMTGSERADYDAFFENWEALPNTAVLEDGRYLGPFQASDLLIIDGLSFLTEYQLNEKPVIHLSRPDRSEPNRFGELVFAGTHELPVARVCDLENMIDGILSGEIEQKLDAQRRLKALLTEKSDPAGEIINALKADLRPASSK